MYGSTVKMNCNGTRFLHRFLTLPLFLKSIRTVRVVHPTNLKHKQFTNFHIGYKSFSSNTFSSKSEMSNSGEGDAKALNVNYEQLLQVQKDNSVLIIDVREQSEIDKTGALPGSIHIPMCEIVTKLTCLSCEDFKKKYNKPLPSKDTKLVFSCMSGKRSAIVQDQIQKLGYKNAYNYTGGWSEWECKQKCR